MNASFAATLNEGLHGFRSLVNNVVDSRWNKDPFCKSPMAPASEYQALFEAAKRVQHPEIDEVERETGFAVDRQWLDDLAFHTQIVKKTSQLAYPHGRLLYSLLRKYIADTQIPFVTALETGTARGFSALCLAKAIEDSDSDGRVITMDVLPHLRKQFWNCIDDHEGKKTRAELLSPWKNLLDKIVFIQGDTLMILPRLGIDRVHFSFLDAQHIRKSVLHEFSEISPRQLPGDFIFFDDVTPAAFPGVYEAVKEIESKSEYNLRYLTISEQRAYAWGSKR